MIAIGLVWQESGLIRLFIYFLHDTSRVYFKLRFAGIAHATTELYSNAEVSAVTAVSSLW